MPSPPPLILFQLVAAAPAQGQPVVGDLQSARCKLHTAAAICTHRVCVRKTSLSSPEHRATQHATQARDDCADKRQETQITAWPFDVFKTAAEKVSCPCQPLGPGEPLCCTAITRHCVTPPRRLLTPNDRNAPYADCSASLFYLFKKNILGADKYTRKK